MSDTAGFLICLAFVLVGLYNSWRAWHWTEVPEVLEGRERMIPVQVPVVIFFGAGIVLLGLEAIAGHPEGGSPGAIAIGVAAGLMALTGLLLAISTYWFGRPHRLIPPIARDVPRWAPRHHAER
jgi:hypothetical protein